jgi:8-oxo-dGTP pyrophosphatase MutT (NUDIX family)
LREKVVEEFREELGIKEREIISVRLGEVFDQNEPRYQKTWIVHPILVRVASDRVVLDWEAQKYAWVTMREAGKLKLLPGCRTVLQKIKPLMRK